MFVYVNRSGGAGGWTVVCLLGGFTCSAAGLLLPQDQDFLLPYVAFPKKKEHMQEVLSVFHCLSVS